jgi:hypothetical protein
MEPVDKNLKLAAMVVSAFDHYSVARGETLMAQHITAYGWNEGLSTTEVAAGVCHALKERWITAVSEGQFALSEQALLIAGNS